MFSRLFSGHRDRARTRRLLSEQLESRCLMAGDVSVAVRDGSLLLTGDDAPNDVVIRRDGTNLLVEGRNATRINGGTAAFQVASTQVNRDIIGNFFRGNDVVSITGVTLTGLVDLRTHRGDDRIDLQEVSARDVVLVTDRGHDVAQLRQVTTTADLSLFLGRGDDVVGQSNVTVGGVWRIDGAGRGNKSIAVGDLQVTGRTEIQLGRGNDQFAVVDQATFGNQVQIRGGRGRDMLVFNPSRGGGTTAFSGPLDIDLGRGRDMLSFDTSVTATGSVNLSGGRGRDQASGNLLDRATNTFVQSIENRGSAAAASMVDAVFASLARAGIPSSFFTTASTRAPTITLATGSVTYTENATAVVVDPALTVADTDSPNLRSATIAITSGFVAAEDGLTFTASGGITGSYNSTTGVLTLTGDATLAAWQTVLRTVAYANSSNNPSTTDRVLRFTVSDGAQLGTAQRTIRVVAVDDPGNLTLPSPFGNSGTTVQRTINTLIEFTAMVNDPDNTDYVFSLDLDQSGIPQDGAQPTINSSTGRFTWTPNRTGVFTIRVIATNGNGFADQETFRIEITS